MNKVGKNTEKAARRWQVKHDAEKARGLKAKVGWTKALKLLNSISEVVGVMPDDTDDALLERVKGVVEREKKLQEVYLRSAGPSPDGKKFTIDFESSLAPIIAQHLLGVLDGKDAKNYVEVVCMPKNGKRVAITIQRCEAKTPHDLRKEADEKVAKAVEALKKLQSHFRSLNSGDQKIIDKTLAEIESKPVEPIKLAFPNTKAEETTLRAEGWKPANEVWPKP